MNKYLKGLLGLLGTIGGSIAVGWWISRRQQDAQHRPLPYFPEVNRSKSSSDIHVQSQITLPPEAFEAVEIEEELESDSVVSSDADVDEADDLTVIKGIGPKVAAALETVGISRFAELASQNAEELKPQLTDIRASVTMVQAWIDAAQELSTSS